MSETFPIEDPRFVTERELQTYAAVQFKIIKVFVLYEIPESGDCVKVSQRFDLLRQTNSPDPDSYVWSQGLGRDGNMLRGIKYLNRDGSKIPHETLIGSDGGEQLAVCKLANEIDTNGRVSFSLVFEEDLVPAGGVTRDEFADHREISFILTRFYGAPCGTLDIEVSIPPSLRILKSIPSRKAKHGKLNYRCTPESLQPVSVALSLRRRNKFLPTIIANHPREWAIGVFSSLVAAGLVTVLGYSSEYFSNSAPVQALWNLWGR